jgi:hypothetical protein
MKPLPIEDSLAIYDLVEQFLSRIFGEARSRLSFPIKITATRAAGFICAGSIAHREADLVFVPVEEIAMVVFPITVTCRGRKGEEITGILHQPERHSKGNA